FNPSSFNQGQLHRPQVNQAPVYQAPIPQTQRVSQTDFESYVKANDAILRSMQSQGLSTQNQCQNIQNQYQNLQIQMATLTNIMSKFVSANIASSSGSGTLPGNTITNPKEELKGITTRSGVAYQGPKTPSPSKQGTKVFPPSKTTNLRNEITRFQQRFDESFYEAWERFNDLLRACPHHGFSELYQLDTFYNALNVNDQYSLNSTAGENFLDKMPRECLKIIESKSKVRQSRAKAFVAKVNQAPVYQAPIPQTQRVSQTDFESYVKANDAILRSMQSQGLSTQNQCQNIQNQYQNLQIQMATLTNIMSKFVSANIASSSGSGTLPGNTITNPKEELKGITTRSGVAYQGPKTPSPSKQGTKPSIPYPSRRDNEKRCDQANEQIEKFYEIFKEMSFKISFTDALILMPKFASTLKALIGNKEKLSEMARTTMNEHCSAVIWNKFPRKLGDPSKFLIPCEFPGMDV
nr:hypothetical protein [Tanacetum cinerariifolium]